MVADFGIALAASAAQAQRITGTGLVVGTPEVHESRAGARRGDATAGAISTASPACCTSCSPASRRTPAPSPTSIIAKRLMDPVPPCAACGHRPRAVDEAIAQALAKVPADRFASVGEFAAALIAPSPARPRATAVAVLPFRNLSADPENEYFADGITEDVIAHLSKIRALKVISRNSVMAFKQRTQSLREIGAQLGATALLDGSVRRAGDRVRIVAQLIDGESDRHLWTETYDREARRHLRHPDRRRAPHRRRAEAELSGEEQTRVRQGADARSQAYQLFLQGRQCYIKYTPESMSSRSTTYDRAVARDPSFALALANMAMSYIELAEHGAMEPEAAYERATDAARKAVAADPELGDAHCMVAYLKMTRAFDWTGAEADFRRAGIE